MSKEIKDQIKELENEKQRELEERKERYDNDLAKVFQGNGEDARRFKRLRKSDPKEAKIADVKEHAIVNLDALKEFIKYGSNKVLDQIRIRNQANVIAREEIEKLKKKEGVDMKQAVLSLAVMAIIGVMVYVVVINFMDYSTVTKDLTTTKIQVGTVSGQLAACQSELAQYKPQGARPIAAAPLPGQEPSNTLEG